MENLKAYRDESTGRWTLEGVEPSEKTFDRICQMLRDKVNFKFARYGDGELLCMSGKIGRNCDQHEYFPDLGLALNDAFYSDPQYMVGIQPLSVSGGIYQRAIAERPGPKNIYDADVLHSASIDGKLGEFFDSLKNRYVIIIGPAHLCHLPKVSDSFEYFTHIKIPDHNCWTKFEEVDSCIGCRGVDTVYLLCASMMAEVLIHQSRDYNHTFIDCGSVFDPYVGKLSRSYHHKLKLNASL